MSQRNNTLYLKHILEAIDWIGEYVKDAGFEEFQSNHLMQDGVIRQLEIIGVASRHIDENFRKLYPDIPWKDMAGMRNKLQVPGAICKSRLG